MLRSLDSWIAVAIAIDTARAGIPRFPATIAMIAAFPACSGSISATLVAVVVAAAVAVQCSRIGTGPTEPFHQAQAPTPDTPSRPTKASPTTRPRWLRRGLRLPLGVGAGREGKRRVPSD